MRNNSGKGRSARTLQYTVGLAILIAPSGLPQCGQDIEMRSYSVCVPAGWKVDRNIALDEIIVCDREKRCATAWGDAPTGLAFLVLRPAEGVYGQAHYDNARAIVSAAPHGGLSAPQITEVRLGNGRAPEGARKCFVARQFLSWAGAWDENYGLEVNKRLFSVWTRYEDDPKKINGYRAGIRQILASISPK